MRIGIDARLRAYRSGGISQHVTRLIEGFESLGLHEAIVVFEHRKADRASRASRTLETRRLFTPPHHRLEGWTLPLELAVSNIDVWHAVDVVVPRGWRGASVATVHDVAFLRRPELLTPDSARYYARVHRSVAQADRVIVVSEHTRRELIALTTVDAGRVRVVPNAVHPRFFSETSVSDGLVLDRYGLTAGYVLFVSTIEPRKNVDTLLRAHRHLMDEGRDARLVLAGADGWRSEGVYALADELNLGDRARFLGFVPDDDLGALYRQACVLAHPAWDEGFGLTPLEAMASGTPTIVSDAGSLAEVVGDAAEHVPPDDVAAWSAAIGRALDRGGRTQALTDAGRRRAAEFTTERMATATLAVYREAAREHAPRRHPSDDADGADDATELSP